MRFHLYDMSRTDESLGSSLPYGRPVVSRAGSVRKRLWDLGGDDENF